jgi:hypothetical protein
MWPGEVGSTPNEAQQPNVSLEPATRRAGRCNGEQEVRERGPCGLCNCATLSPERKPV